MGIKKWAGQCLRKKRLKEEWADNIIKRSEVLLYKYFCLHCSGWHLTSQKKYANRVGNETLPTIPKVRS